MDMEASKWNGDLEDKADHIVSEEIEIPEVIGDVELIPLTEVIKEIFPV